jgi:hypothetical protein
VKGTYHLSVSVRTVNPTRSASGSRTIRTSPLGLRSACDRFKIPCDRPAIDLPTRLRTHCDRLLPYPLAGSSPRFGPWGPRVGATRKEGKDKTNTSTPERFPARQKNQGQGVFEVNRAIGTPARSAATILPLPVDYSAPSETDPTPSSIYARSPSIAAVWRMRCPPIPADIASVYRRSPRLPLISPMVSPSRAVFHTRVFLTSSVGTSRIARACNSSALGLGENVLASMGSGQHPKRAFRAAAYPIVITAEVLAVRVSAWSMGWRCTPGFVTAGCAM